ncbi:nudix hydrolase 13 [Phyllostomus discolor]|nr:nudix hydrolase 13 [Phyllostomus discolor]
MSASLQKPEMEAELRGSFIELRKALFRLNVKDASLLSTAQALLRWHDAHQFCSRSGQPTKKNVAGSKRVCPSNKIIYYPQMAPVVITLVSDGTRCLLARQSSFPKGMYSALAGFCDIGKFRACTDDTGRRKTTPIVVISCVAVIVLGVSSTFPPVMSRKCLWHYNFPIFYRQTFKHTA